METLILTQSQVRQLADMSEVVAAVERAFLAHGRGEVDMPAKVYLDITDHDGDFRAMPARMAGDAGVKWVNSHPENPKRHGLPSVMGMYILSDPATAQPRAVMDATLLTALRTGAAAAVASKHLAVGAPRTIGFIGCGVQARVMLDAHRVLFADLEVRGADANESAAKSFAEEVGGTATSIERACACDIVCTSTPVRTPVVMRAFIGDGTHVNAMGADAEGKQEVEAALLSASKVVIDDYQQATHSGEVNVPLHKGQYSESAIFGTIGEIVAGKKLGREGDEITLFDSTGLAVQDVAVAAVIAAAAEHQGVGTRVDFRA